MSGENKFPSLNQTLERWKTDCCIDESAIVEESVRFAKLHGVYLDLSVQVKLYIDKLENYLAELKKDKHSWYSGRMSKQEMDDRSWKYDPFDNHTKPLKTDLQLWYDADADIQKLKSKIYYYRTYANALDDILTTIKWRHSTIKNIMDMYKFSSGN